MKRIILTGIFLFIFGSFMSLNAQWAKTYGGSDFDRAYLVQKTSDGGYIAAGYTASFGAGISDFWILKLSLAGDIEWQRTYGGSGDDVAHSIQETSDEGYIVAGYTDSFGVGESDFLVLKLFSNGDIDPSCELIGSSNAAVLATSAFYAYTNIPPQITSFDPQDTNISPQETYATANLLCEARPTISGAVKTEEGEGVEGVTITFSYEEGTATTESEGSYSYTVIEGWSGIATPYKTCYGFLPSNRSYSNLTSDQPNQDYTGTLIQHTLIINAGPGGTTQPSQGSYNYDCGTQVEISASPDSGYKFSDWSGNVPSGHESDNPLTITMDSDKSITANFEKESFWERLCFIATAAYDSPLHPHVKILRDFRDTYLMSNKFGRKLVDLYYKYSPFAAGLITKHKALRIAVRINLLPLVAFSYSMLHFCRVVTAVAGVFIFVFPIFLIWFYRRKARIYRKRNRKAK